MNRSARIGLALLALLGAFVFFLLTVGSLGDPQPDVQRMSVERVLTEPDPVAAFGSGDLYISGWYAELDAGCQPLAPSPVPGGDAPWLERTCPMRVLMPYQPAEMVSQHELQANGLRLAAPDGRPFPSRSRPDGPNLRLQQLVYAGHFDDPSAAFCSRDLADLCRRTFVVSDYDGLLR